MGQKTRVRPIKEDTVLQDIAKDINEGEYRTIKVESLPGGICLPTDYLDKCVAFTIAVSGGTNDHGWVGVFAHRLDREKGTGEPTIDHDPLVIGYKGNTVASTGMLAHHADYHNNPSCYPTG